MKSKTKRKGFSPLSLDAVNFLVADVRGAVGPYLNVFLVTQQHWSQSEVGFVTTIGGLVGIAVQTPIGAAIDETHAKRGVIVLALAVLAVTAVVIFAYPTFLAGGGRQQRDGSRRRRLRSRGRGPDLGPVRTAATGAANGTERSLRSCRQCRHRRGGGRRRLRILAARRVLAGSGFRHADGDRGAVHSRQGHRLQPGERPGGGARGGRKLHWGRRLRHSVQVAAAGHLRSVRHAVPFRQRAIAAAGGTEARGGLPQGSDGDDVDLFAAQAVMLPIALLVGSKADTWGRKPLFLAGFAILPIRAVLYTLSDNSFWLIGVQVLDGVGAGIFGALAPLVIADIIRGTGRYNLALGAIDTVQGIGASLSGLAAGEIVDHFGYSAAFLTLGAAALVAVIVFFLQMPETAEPETTERETVLKS